jgi:hypothetical protein
MSATFSLPLQALVASSIAATKNRKAIGIEWRVISGLQAYFELTTLLAA